MSPKTQEILGIKVHKNRLHITICKTENASMFSMLQCVRIPEIEMMLANPISEIDGKCLSGHSEQ